MLRWSRRELLVAAAASLYTAGAHAREVPKMTTRPIPRTGEALPVIGMGTWQTFDVGTSSADRAPLREVLGELVARGGKLVDSSPMYGASERVLGDLARDLGVRDRLFLATKVWTRGRAEGVAQMESSLAKLGVRAVDLMQVHNLIDVDTHLDTLAGWKKDGRTRYVGITHYTDSAHDAVAQLLEKREVDFVQINYSAEERGAEARLLEVARDRGVAVIANRPFAGGDLIRRLTARPVPSWASALECTSWAQLLLKFVVSHPAITAAIPATSKLKHLRDNLRAGSGPMPDDALRAQIARAAAG